MEKEIEKLEFKIREFEKIAALNVGNFEVASFCSLQIRALQLQIADLQPVKENIKFSSPHSTTGCAPDS